MRRRTAAVSVLVVSVLCGAATPVHPDEPSTPPGRRVYDREACAMCHSIGGKGNRRRPLDGVGGRLPREDIRRWIVSPQEMDANVRKKAYRLSEDELDALVDYLAGL